MQRYNCSNCKEDAYGGSTVVFEGVFMKLCAECAEDDMIYKELQERMMEIPIEEDDKEDNSGITFQLQKKAVTEDLQKAFDGMSDIEILEK